MNNADWINIVVATAACASVLVAAYTIRRSSTVSKILKRADVAMHCTLRYEELKMIVSELDERYGEVPTEEKDKNRRNELLRMHWTHYYSRYWALKSDQFDFWLYGLLEHGTFLDWSYSTALSFLRDKHGGERRLTCPLTYREAWEQWKKDDHGPVNPNFLMFTERLIRLADTSLAHNLSWRAVFDEIVRFHGTFWKPGVSRWLQSQAWRGVSLTRLRRVLESNDGRR